jgi:adenylate cyclase class 1
LPVKFPLGLAFDSDGDVDYRKLAADYERDVFGDYDAIDLGNLERVEREEYFGAALWQFNKALTHPLKSITKMLILQMSSRFPPAACSATSSGRSHESGEGSPLHRSGTFTIRAIFDFNRERNRDDFQFIQKCIYLRCDMKMHSRKAGMREELLGETFRKDPLSREEIHSLNKFKTWHFHDQVRIGNRALALLLKIYKDITGVQSDAEPSRVSPGDLRIIGRKLSSCLEKKPSKIAVIHKPTDSLNQPTLVFRFNGKKWQVLPADDPETVIVEDIHIIPCIAHLVWNDLFRPGELRMLPNPTSVTLQEILNLGKKIRICSGSTTSPPSTSELQNPGAVGDHARHRQLRRCVGGQERRLIQCAVREQLGRTVPERVVPRMNSRDLQRRSRKQRYLNVHYHVQRTSLQYEKIIERRSIW